MKFLQLPDVILLNILKILPGKDLHRCRRVSKLFNKKILELIWSSKYIKSQISNKIEQNWNRSNYEVTEEKHRQSL